MSDALQSPNFDLLTADDLAQSVITAISEKRTDDNWAAILILPMARHYGVSEENLCAELHQVRRLLKRKEEQGCTINSNQEFLSLMRPYKDAFVDLYKLISDPACNICELRA
ncbi:unnamed protein product [Boreogadus saida]